MSNTNEQIFGHWLKNGEGVFDADKRFEQVADISALQYVLIAESESLLINALLASKEASVKLSSIKCGADLSSVRLDRNIPVSTDGVELVKLATARPKLSQPGLLLMDMDSTAITIECIDEIAKLAGVGEAVAAVTQAAMQGKLDFEQSLRERVAQLRGVPRATLLTLSSSLPLMPGIEALIDELKQHNWKVAVASGGFTHFTATLADMLQLDAHFANELEFDGEQLTGSVIGKVVDAEVKSELLTQLGDDWNIDATQRVAIGDGANDIPMINQAAMGVAFHGKPALIEAANASVNSLGLNALIHLMD